MAKKLVLIFFHFYSIVVTVFIFIDTLDADEWKIKMINLSEKMQKFQFNDELSSLENEQKELENYLINYKLNIAKYNSRQNAIAKGIKLTKISSDNCCDMEDYGDIKDFNSLIAKTGNYNNFFFLLF